MTSGPLSASLTGRNCGLGYVATADAAIGTELEVDIRGKRAKGRVVAMPFCARRVKDEPRSPHVVAVRRFASANPMRGRVSTTDAKDVVAIGLSDFGQRSLGDILSRRVAQGRRSGHERRLALGWVDSYRRAFDIIVARLGRGDRGQCSRAARSLAHQRSIRMSRGRATQGARQDAARVRATAAASTPTRNLVAAAPAIRRMDQGAADDITAGISVRTRAPARQISSTT